MNVIKQIEKVKAARATLQAAIKPLLKERRRLDRQYDKVLSVETTSSAEERSLIKQMNEIENQLERLDLVNFN